MMEINKFIRSLLRPPASSSRRQKQRRNSIEKNHMKIPWHFYTGKENDNSIMDAPLTEKASVIGRVGLIMLSCGTGAWRVRSSMNKLSKELGVSCTVNIGLMSIDFSCIDRYECVAQSLSLPNTGVNTLKLHKIEHFLECFADEYRYTSGDIIHSHLDDIEKTPGLYTPLKLGLAAAFACCAFTFLLGGGPVEMLLAFMGAGVGNYLRMQLIKYRFTLCLNVAASVSAACVTYALLMKLLSYCFGVSDVHAAGYACAMLFIIPGFPFTTSGIDMAKLDIRSGLERFTYSAIIVLIAAMFAWIMALILGLQPSGFVDLGLSPATLLVCRLLASFVGVFGFSIMFNSNRKMAFTAACLGAVANTLRLELVDVDFPPATAAFIGTLLAGVAASAIKTHIGYPRISLTVPSIVIMVPGLYVYRGMYNLGMMNLTDAVSWLTAAALILVSIPLGLIFARILTDKSFRYCT